jgi:hypothetical protein
MPHFRKRDLLPPALAQEESRRFLARRGITTRYKVDAAHIPLYRECWADPAIRALVPLDFKQQIKAPRTQARPELTAAIMARIGPRKRKVWLRGFYAIGVIDGVIPGA